MSSNLLFFIPNVLVLCHSQEVAVLWACQPPPKPIVHHLQVPMSVLLPPHQHQQFTREVSIYYVKLWIGDSSHYNFSLRPESSGQTDQQSNIGNSVRKQTLEWNSLNSEKNYSHSLVLTSVPGSHLMQYVTLTACYFLLWKQMSLNLCHFLKINLKALILWYTFASKCSHCFSDISSELLVFCLLCFVLFFPVRFLREIKFMWSYRMSIYPSTLLVHIFLTCPPSSTNFDIDTVISKILCF